MPPQTKKKPAATKKKREVKAEVAKTPVKKSPVNKIAKPKPVGYVFGRPTMYDPKLCSKVIEFGRNGKSRAWIAAELSISKDTLYEWIKAHQDFADAMAIARSLEQQWWEDLGAANIGKAGFSAGIWNKNMACRFRDDWQEKTSHEVTGKDGAALTSSTDVAQAIADVLREAKRK